MELLTELINSPLYLFLKGVFPEGFDKQVINFVGAYVLLRFTVMKHFKVIEEKLENLTKVVRDGFHQRDQEIISIKTTQEQTISRVEKLELLNQRR